jgi:hypothetical protein
MEIRDAILAAADSIEAQPHRFSFISVNIPDPNGTHSQGCGLGWISSYTNADERERGYQFGSALPALGLKYDIHGCDTFYSRMADFDDEWTDSGFKCAKALRKYANKYHPAPIVEPIKHTGIPPSVLEIFKEKATAIIAIVLAVIGVHHG